MIVCINIFTQYLFHISVSYDCILRRRQTERKKFQTNMKNMELKRVMLLVGFVVNFIGYPCTSGDDLYLLCVCFRFVLSSLWTVSKASLYKNDLHS